MPGLLLVFSRVADRDEGLRLPVIRQSQCLSDQIGTEKGRTQPAGAKIEGMGSQEQVLGSHGRALDGHRPFVLLAYRVGIAVHVSHAETEKDEKGSVGDALVGAAGIFFDQVWGSLIGR